MFLIPIANAAVDTQKLGSVLSPIINVIVVPIVMLMFAIAVVAFAYGILQFVWGGEEKRSQAKMSMLWGIIGMFIMVSAWGIIYLISNTISSTLR